MKTVRKDEIKAILKKLIDDALDTAKIDYEISVNSFYVQVDFKKSAYQCDFGEEFQKNVENITNGNIKLQYQDGLNINSVNFVDSLLFSISDNWIIAEE